MIIKHKHGRLEFLPRQDLPHNSKSSLEVSNSSHAYFFASIGGFL
jgi:5'-deoxynucleotidase YfbR-like HD superfamily hydrolase